MSAAPHPHESHCAAPPSASDALQARGAAAGLAAMLVASLVALLSWGPGAAVSAATATADAAGAVGPAHSLILGGLFNLLAMAVAFGGLHRAARSDLRLAPVWQRFFAVAGLCGASALLDRLVPHLVFHVATEALLGNACALAALLYVAERLGPRRVPAAVLWAATLVGPAFAGIALALNGGHVSHGESIDMRLIGWLQALPLIVLPTVVWRLPSSGLRGSDWLIALLAYGAGQAAAGWGHWLEPLVSAVAVDPAAHPVLQSAGLVVALSWLALAFRRQWMARGAAPVSSPDAAPPAPAPTGTGIASQRSTSEMTSA